MIREKSKSTYTPFNPELNKPRGTPRDKANLPKSQGFMKDMLRAPLSIFNSSYDAIRSLETPSDPDKLWREERLSEQDTLKHKMWLASWRDRGAQRDKQIQADKEAMFKVGPQDPHGGGQTFNLSEWEPGSKGLSPQAQRYLSEQQKTIPRPVASANLPKPDNEYFVEQYRRPEAGVQR